MSVGLRDYFAGQAMQGLLAYQADEAYFVAKEAYTIADAMMAAREATHEQSSSGIASELKANQSA